MAITTKAVESATKAKPAKVITPPAPAATTTIVEPATGEASLDVDPRAGTTADMNRIDMNVPSGAQPPEETVVEQLKDEQK